MSATSAPQRQGLSVRSLLGRTGIWLLLVVLLIWLIVPLAAVFRESFIQGGGLSGAPILEALGDKQLGGVLLNTLVVIVTSTIAATIVGTLLAVAATKLQYRWASALRAIPLVPLTVAPLVGAIGWVFLLAPRTGWLNILIRGVTGGTEGPFDIFSLAGVCWVTTLYAIPYVFATMTTALDRIGSETLEAFLLNGTGRAMATLRVLTGVLRPALTAGIIIAALESAIQFSIPLILDVEVLTTSIYRYVLHDFPIRRDLAAVLGVLLLIFGVALTFAETMFLGRRSFTSVSGRGMAQRGWTFGRVGDRLLIALAMLYLAVSAVLPIAAILLVSLLPFWKPRFVLSDLSLQHFQEIFSSGNFLNGLGNSFKLTVISVVAIIVISLIVSLYRAKNRGLTGRALFIVGSLPLGIPGVVLGLGFLVAFTTGPLPLYGTLMGMAIAYVIHFLPMGLRNIDPVVRQLGSELEEAATVSGASRVRTFLDITLPLILPGISAAAAIVGILALREFPLSSLLSSPATKVVSVYLVDSFENGVFPQVAAMAMCLSVFSMIGVFVLLSVNRRVRFSSKS